MVKGQKWITYDDEESVRQKTIFAFENVSLFLLFQEKKDITKQFFFQDLAGVCIWSIDTDDFLGICSGTKFPLLKNINRAFNSLQTGDF